MAFRMIEGADGYQGIPKAMDASGFFASFPPSLIQVRIVCFLSNIQNLTFILHIHESLSIKFYLFPPLLLFFVFLFPVWPAVSAHEPEKVPKRLHPCPCGSEQIHLSFQESEA